MKKIKFLLFFLLLAHIGFSQFTGKVTYKKKIVYTTFLNKDFTVKSFKLDTIRYSLPFDVTFTTKSVMIDGYGSYNVAQYHTYGNSTTIFHNYILKNGWEVSIGASVMTLIYPVSNLTGKTVMFELEQEIPLR